MKKREKKVAPIDRPFLITVIALVAIGLLTVYSASMYSQSLSGESGYYQFYKQTEYAILGLIVMFVLSRINYRILKQKPVYLTLFIITVILLLLVYVPGIGVSQNGARRWIRLGVSFQPSELAKLTGIIYMAATIVNHPAIIKDNLGKNRGTREFWLYCVIPAAVTCLAIMKEPSLSATLVVALGMGCVLWYSGISIKQLLPVVAIAGVAVFFEMTQDWRMTRVLTFFGASEENWQIYQSLVGLSSGGLFGVGIGNGKQKLFFLPEIQNDFIFANIGEEVGLVGCLFVLFLYAFLIYRGFQIATHCKDRFGFLYTISVITVLAFQVFINVAVATQTLPVTGMALPFISYGGTSIVILLTTIGPILNISRTVHIGGVFGKWKWKRKNPNRRRRNRRPHLSGNRNIRGAKADI